MRQTLAIFVDAYRELNSRKLFWIVLAISVAVVVALGLPSNNERGVSVFGLTAEIPFLTTKAVSPVAFYKFLFSWFGINLWLAWGATILALISTAGMIPEMVSSGAIELVLSKPVSRLRLFLTKYAAGLIFVALQATVFSIGTILVIGIRGGSWDARPLLAVPLMVLFFSYLFSVCVLVGMLTRSTLLALLATVLVWLGTWAVATVEQFMLDQRLRQERDVERMHTQVETFKTTLAALDEQIKTLEAENPPTEDQSPDASPVPAVAPKAPVEPAATTSTPAAATQTGEPPQPPEPPRRGPGPRGQRRLLDAGKALLRQVDAASGKESLQRNRDSIQNQIRQLEQRLPEVEGRSETTTRWHRRVFAIAAVVPKTGETKRLFQRFVLDKSDVEGFLKVLMQESGDEDAGTIEKALDERSLSWVIGTSLAFEFVILGVATFIFVRRDF